MRIAIHQPNLMPNFGYFYKMSQADIFVILEKVQFEKNGFTNRYYIHEKEKWVTKPVVNKMEPICDKYYTDGQKLVPHNMQLIYWIADTLGINTDIVFDVESEHSSTMRLIDNLRYYGATSYVTSPTAKDRYLDEVLITNHGIEIEYCKPQFAELNILEMFEKFGIDGTKKQLYKKKGSLCKV